MEKQFKNDLLDLRCMDCMDLMAQYPDKHFDLAICDIQYGIGASHPSKKPHSVKQSNGNILRTPNNNYKPKDWDDSLMHSSYFDELFRVSKRQIIFGGNYYGLEGGYLVWDKLNGESDQFGCELAWVSDSNRTDIVYYMWHGMMQGVYCGKDVRKALVQQGNKALNEKRIHPTQKPVILYKYILNEYAKIGDKILDTHLGSASIALACEDMGFELVASEKEEDIFQDCIQRVKPKLLQSKMF